jgi:glycolate oxidase
MFFKHKAKQTSPLRSPLESSLEDFMTSIEGVVEYKNDPLTRHLYASDAYTLVREASEVMVFPVDHQQVCFIVKAAAQFNIPLVVRGAGTCLSGGAKGEAGAIGMVLTKLRRVIDYSPSDRLITVEAGVVNQFISDYVKPDGLYFAPDPSSQFVSTIGGNVSENAGGAHTLKYGVTQRHLSRARVVWPDGKDEWVSDPRLLAVLAGSEGTLGIMTEFELSLTPTPPVKWTALVEFNSVAAAAQCVQKMVSLGVTPAALEMMDKVIITPVEQKYKLGIGDDCLALLLIDSMVRLLTSSKRFILWRHC